MKTDYPSYSVADVSLKSAPNTPFAMTFFEEMKPPSLAKVHRHSFYEVLWVEAGNSRHSIDFTDYELKASSLFFISPGQLHSMEEWKHLKGGTLLFTEDFFLTNMAHKDQLFELSFLDNTYAHPQITLDTEHYLEINQTLQTLRREYEKPDRNYPLLRAMLQVLLLQIQQRVSSEQRYQPKDIVLFKKFKESIEQYFDTDYGVEQHAHNLYISPDKLNTVCKMVTGKKASEVIRQRKLLEAKRLLGFSDNSITEIAEQLHFNDGSYFAKAFKKETGLSPGSFRKLQRDKYRKARE